MAERYGCGIYELIVDGYRESCSQTERKDHSSRRNSQSRPPVTTNDGDIHFQSDEEEEDHQPDGRDEVQVWQGRGREDGITETWDSSHHGGSEDDTTDDFRNDTRLSDVAEEPPESLGEDDDDDELDDEEGDWLEVNVGG